LSRFNTCTANQNQWVWLEHRLLLRCNWGFFLRLQAAAYVATHVQHRSDSALFDDAAPYRQRHCVQPWCKRRRVTDSTTHVSCSTALRMRTPPRHGGGCKHAALAAAAGPGHNPLLAAAPLAALGSDMPGGSSYCLAPRLQAPYLIIPAATLRADFIRTIDNTRWPR
jgi:hypothetical protein